MHRMARYDTKGPHEDYAGQLTHRKKDIAQIIADQVRRNAGSESESLHRNAAALAPMQEELENVFMLYDEQGRLPNLNAPNELKVVRREIVAIAEKYGEPRALLHENAEHFANELLSAVATRLSLPDIDLPEVTAAFAVA